MARALTDASTSERKQPFVLVVHSDPKNVKYLSTLLRRFQYQSFTTTSGAEALSICSVKLPSLIITGASLKDMDAPTFIKNMSEASRIASIPFLALTKPGDLQAETRCFEAGALDCLTDPPAVEALFRAIQAIMEPTPRMNIRIRTMQPITLTNFAMDEREGAYTLDLSEGGMFVRTLEPAPLNARVSLQLELTGRMIPVEAAVLYRYETTAGPYKEPGMGLGFVRIAPKDQECIRSFIRSELTRGIMPCNA